MNILYICHRFPFPPKRGGKIRPFNMISHWNSAGHKVTVCSLARSPEEMAEGKGIAAHCNDYDGVTVSNPIQVLRMVARLPLKTPSSMGYFYSPDLDLRIRELLAKRSWDLLFVHCSSVAQYVEDVNGIPKILDFGDMDSQKWLEYANYKPFPLSLGYRLEGNKMMAAEKRLASKFDLCTATTHAECETLASYEAGVPIDWFPNGVDAEFFKPDGDGYDQQTICFVGRMDYYPNQECMQRFCAQVWPRLKQVRPHMRLLIVGADPPVAIRNLARLPGVQVTGSVVDVRPFVQRSALMVAPLAIARGTQNKILESMAMGVPVVTSRVAAGGVDANANEHLVVADQPQKIAEAILRITDDANERDRLSQSGRARVLSHHAWAGSMRRLDALVSRCVGDFRSSPR